jgi:hypothetical protein
MKRQSLENSAGSNHLVHRSSYLLVAQPGICVLLLFFQEIACLP